jgi:hypothetical protein|tara:strand:+ start:865 stop:1062 length:198 start_codon:yes stop_codon:yes gene_type:complete
MEDQITISAEDAKILDSAKKEQARRAVYMKRRNLLTTALHSFYQENAGNCKELDAYMADQGIEQE